MTDHELDGFFATHEIIMPSGARFPVRWEDNGPESFGAALYTRAEWNTSAAADWEYHPDDGLTCQGKIVDGVRFERIPRMIFRVSP